VLREIVDSRTISVEAEFFSGSEKHFRLRAGTSSKGRSLVLVKISFMISIAILALGSAAAALFFTASKPAPAHQAPPRPDDGQVHHGPHAPDAWAGKPVMSREHVNGMVNARLNNAPKLGELAPDFSLVNAMTGEVANLRQLCKDKPAVLFFASYSCNISHDSAELMSKMAQQFAHIANFFIIYIQEAHPEGGFAPLDGASSFVIPAPLDFAYRVEVAQRLAKEAQYNFPVLVDSMGDSVNSRWGAWPVRLFVVDRQGEVAYSGQQGPWFFKPTRSYDPKVPNIPEGLRNLPGYSKESLEEYLEALAARVGAGGKT
jgi:type I thyroxine 5'-deiodinase